MNQSEILLRCISTLQGCHAHCAGFAGADVLSGESRELPPAAFCTASDFAVRTMTAMDHALSQPELAIMALTLCRPFYELAVAILWAAREPDGWRRLLMRYAKDDETAAKEATACPAMAGVAEVAQRILSRVRTVLAWADASGEQLKAAPNVLEMLHSITKFDEGESVAKRPSHYAKLDYAAYYRNMCRPAHGNLLFVGTELADFSLRLATTVAVLSTHRLLQAFCRIAVCVPDQKAAIRLFDDDTAHLLARCQDLTFSSAPSP